MEQIYELSALTAEGFGGREIYRKVVTVKNDTALAEEKRKFALQFNVELEMIKEIPFVQAQGGNNERTFKSI